MRHALSLAFLVFFLASHAISQQAQMPPAWDVTLRQDTTADSTITVINQCRRTHQFSIQPNNVPFLRVSQNQVRVPGRRSVLVPVQFNTYGLELNRYEGNIVVVCMTCSSEPTCTQDREVLTAIARIVAPERAPRSDQTPQKKPGTSDEQARIEIPKDDEGWWDKLDRSKLPVLEGAYSSFRKGPCPELESACERKRWAAAEHEATAANARMQVERLKQEAADADMAAMEAERKALDAESRAKPDGPVTAVVNGESFTQADLDYLQLLRKRNQEDYLVGKINEAQYQRRANELTTRQARQERLAERAKLEKEAESSRSAANSASKEADEKRRIADSAAQESERLTSKALESIGEYQKCLDELQAECQRRTQAIADAERRREEEVRAADAAKAANERARAAEEKRQKQLSESARIQQEEFEYLIDNIKKLGLISYTPRTNIPQSLDWFFDSLQSLTGQTVRDFLQTVAMQIGGGKVDPTVINALGEMYKALGSFFDIRTRAGKERAVRRLQEMTNPKTGRKYNLNEALEKIGKMEKLMRELRSKLEEARREAARATR